MKLRCLVLGILFPFVIGCSGWKDASENLQMDNSGHFIVGGRALSAKDVAARYVVMIYDSNLKKSCTGTIIDTNIILTAAHCVGSSPRSLTIAFGVDPLSGRFTPRKVRTMRVHSGYKKSASKDRNDLALLAFEGDLPMGYKPAFIPDGSFPVSKEQLFTAVGYGRTSGKSAKDNSRGIGRLRGTELRIHSIDDDQKQFVVSQANGKGICAGDSGGPAMVRAGSRDYIIGVVSAISLTLPGEMSANEKSSYLAKKDLCADKSIYMNLKYYSGWIQSAKSGL